MKEKEVLIDLILDLVEGSLVKNQIEKMIEIPKYTHMGDLAFPCFELAKIYRKSPHLIARDFAIQIHSSLFENVEAVGGYVNVFLNKQQVTSRVINTVLTQKEQYGDLKIGQNEIITLDFSSPNIAKPFSMGHLRSTVIGNALSLICEKCGYQTVRINHIGDWGTQFGKLMVAYKMWGNDEEIKKNPIKELLKLYIKFHKEEEANPLLSNEAREWFKKLEDGDAVAIGLWQWFREESLKEFSKIYQLLGIEFDSYNGEAFYNVKMERVVQILEDKGLLKESEGAHVVELGHMPPCLIKKSDGTTLYATRDLAAALYRQETYQFSKALYIVGNEQSLHFQQLFHVLRKMGYDWQNGMVHIPFGMMLKDGKKMSTRKGKVVLLETVLEEAINMAEKAIEDRNPSLQKKEEVAVQVGTGAVIFHDLVHYRLHDIEFSLDDMLRFEGETGPYIQYTHARASSLLKKGNFTINDEEVEFIDEKAWPIIVLLNSFSDTINRSLEAYDPSQIAKYLIDLSQSFNKYYATVRILDQLEQRQNRLSIVFAVKTVLKEGLRLLGIKAPEEM
ncbi:arginine--tRNA ligase [Robertmurraya sp. P23]|uniref:arginine--tRNA ligase n=1 Tax=Robertmurraya sp. P23 TaxID=3436931 RepID=UPI003D984021